MRLFRPRYAVLLISILMIVAGVATASAVQSNFGTMQVQQVDLFTAQGVLVHTTLQVPLAASPSNQLPAVVVIHGVIQSKEWLMAFGIELGRRGFVVLTIDAVGHGDSGPGVSDDIRDMIFEPFYRGDRSGLGLGLAIAKSLVELHNGRIWVENKTRHQGSVFCVALHAHGVEVPGRAVEQALAR